ncbi:MAG TPA: fumarylacetoacetate hydrolase family protein, partial [Gammaproteobacteria bacterium]|nr:fumarylacetoacetate hydrolase family protein [Gammaproteobacteria bacterium]
MKLVSFERDGAESFGVVVGDGIVDARRRIAGFAGIRDLLRAGALNELRSLEKLAPDHRLDEVTLLPVIPDAAAKILCVGVNYLPHIAEMGRERPDRPVIFVRFVDSVVGHGEPMIRPPESEQYDYEGELAVVIGRRARRVSRAEALEHVAGYSCFNDGSVRDFQRHGPQWTPGKNFHRSGAFGPWLVTRDELPDPARCRLTTRLNGTVVQDESVGELCFDVPKLIEYCST